MLVVLLLLFLHDEGLTGSEASRIETSVEFIEFGNRHVIFLGNDAWVFSRLNLVLFCLGGLF